MGFKYHYNCFFNFKTFTKKRAEADTSLSSRNKTTKAEFVNISNNWLIEYINRNTWDKYSYAKLYKALIIIGTFQEK